MKIEIATLGRMTQTGSSLMTLYQDKHTPILDLLVREAIQNSLDAGKCTNENAKNKKYVEINFLTGDFSPKQFNANLEVGESALNKRFNTEKARFLAIKDKYTVGLTGPLNINKVKDYKYGNLLKLVYDICKPQENAGSGGSWGIGKTIYFRLGKGLVVYYSRIYDDNTCEFQSRLAVSLVEDEHSKETIVPKESNPNYTGIAWWGKSAGNNVTEPITDENEINNFLEIFQIDPFKEEETGTVIIIPYIDEEALLNNNRTRESDSEIFIPNWQKTIDEYINIAAQRWYFPRLNNKQYKYGKYLKININGNILKSEEMLPVFKLGQALYNCSISGSIESCKDFCEENNITIRTNKIAVRKHFANDTCSGYVSYAEVDKYYMEMCPPNNLYSPFNYIDVEENESETNQPIFTFCRKPGMAVSYKGVDNWLYNVPNSEKNKFIVAIFVLNSDNRLSEVDTDLEEYVRKSEMANHNSWEDYPIDFKTRDIINKIKKNTARELSKAFQSTDSTSEERINTGLGQKLADLILPKTGFGRIAKTKTRTPKRSKEYTVHKDISIALLEDEIVYMGDTIEVTYDIKSNKKTDAVILNNYISSEKVPIHPEEWEDNGLVLPFKLQSTLIRIVKLDENNTNYVYSLDENSNIIDDKFICEWNKSKAGNNYGITLKFMEAHDFKMTISFTMKITARDIKSIIKAE